MHNPWASQEGGSNGQVKRGEQVCMLAEHAIFLAKMWSCLLCHVLLPPCELGHVACYSFRAPLLLLASATTRLRVRQSSSSWPSSSSIAQAQVRKHPKNQNNSFERECLCKSSCWLGAAFLPRAQMLGFLPKHKTHQKKKSKQQKLWQKRGTCLCKNSAVEWCTCKLLELQLLVRLGAALGSCQSTSQKTPQKKNQNNKNFGRREEVLGKNSAACRMVHWLEGMLVRLVLPWVLAKAPLRKHTKRKTSKQLCWKNWQKRWSACARAQLSWAPK